MRSKKRIERRNTLQPHIGRARSLSRFAVMVSAVLAVSSCTVPMERAQPIDTSIAETLEAAVAAPAPAPRPATAAPTVAKPDLEPQPERIEADRFDVNSDNTPAQQFLMALVQDTPMNMVVHPDVTGNISLSLKDVTVVEVLDTVQEIYGLSYRAMPSGFVVLPATLQRRIFQVDYLNLERGGVSRTRVSSGQVSESTGSDRSRGGSASANNSNTQQSRPARDAQQVSGSRIDSRFQADFWSELRETLEVIIGNGEGRQVVVNTQTGVILVRAMPEELRHVEAYLVRVQDVAQRQVILEAKIVEVQLNDGYQAGINWVAVAQSGDDTYTYGQVAPTGALDGDFDDLGGAPITVSPGTVVDGFVNSTIGGAFTMAFDVGDFNAFIELLEVQGDTRVLSSPRVSTLNNQKAVIKAGTDEFFVTDVASNTVTGTSSTTTRDVELTPFFSGIALDVTPQISADGEVILHIHPTVSEVTDQQKVLTVSGTTDTLPLAFSEIRESDSVVRARSGQIIVIGGLMRNSSRDETFGAPGLSRLPGVGRLFRSQRAVMRKTELVILLKPLVVDSDSVWSDVANESLQRVQLFGQ